MELHSIVQTDLWNFFPDISLVIDLFHDALISLGHPTHLILTHLTTFSGDTSRKGSTTEVPYLCLNMHLFSISTDELVPLKFVMAKRLSKSTKIHINFNRTYMSYNIWKSTVYKYIFYLCC